ncbi:MAG: hypothetical protein PVI30_12405 [Myxococcales bacterium]|jgi:hypothetical protein
MPRPTARRSAVGEAREDGMIDEVATHLREAGSRICADAEALRWLYGGGTV